MSEFEARSNDNKPYNTLYNKEHFSTTDNTPHISCINGIARQRVYNNYRRKSKYVVLRIVR